MGDAVFREVARRAGLETPRRLIVDPEAWPDPPPGLADRTRPVVLVWMSQGGYVALEPEGAPAVTGAAFPLDPDPPQGPSVDASARIGKRRFEISEIPARALLRTVLDQGLASGLTDWASRRLRWRHDPRRTRGILAAIGAGLVPEEVPAAVERLLRERIRYQLRFHRGVAGARLEAWRRNGREPGPEETRLLRAQLAEWSRHRDPRAGCVLQRLEWYVRAEPAPAHLAPFCCLRFREVRQVSRRLLFRWPSDRLCLSLVAGLTGEPVSTRRDALLALVSAEDDRLRSWGIELSAKADLSGPGRGR